MLLVVVVVRIFNCEEEMARIKTMGTARKSTGGQAPKKRLGSSVRSSELVVLIFHAFCLLKCTKLMILIGDLFFFFILKKKACWEIIGKEASGE